MNRNMEKLRRVIPSPPLWRIRWDELTETPFGPFASAMARTRQNLRWHGEGDVWTHTKMVCEALAADEEYRQLSEPIREILFLAALCHDIGKIPCTRLEDGTWTSPNHTLVGAKMAREMLWRDFGFCGTEELRAVRECVCALIRYHSVPVHILDQQDGERRLIQMAAQGELISDFSLSLLRLLVRADLKGRLSNDLENSWETAALCFEMAAELDILEGPYDFPSPATRYAWLSGRNVWRNQELYDETWGEVILMCGLPGTGKDTWLKAHYPDLPMISLDEIREELGISPKKPQGTVVAEARQRARELLRERRPFAWNATNTTVMTRRKLLSLFEQYHASVRIVFLETSWESQLERNGNRREQVPRAVIEKMLKNLELPELQEARNVEWLCV